LGRQKFIAASTGFACYMLGFAIGESLLFVYMKKAYLAQQATKGAEQLAIVKQCLDLFNPTMLLVICLLTFITAYLGSFWGKRLLQIHFEKAGIV
jgi:energy-coupling factor transport system substrate-specific component